MSLTLLEIATHVCEVTGLTDNLSVEQAKRFVRRRWQMLWDSRTWRQARAVDMLTVTAGEPEVALPVHLELVTAARLGERELIGVRDSEAMQISPAYFYESQNSPVYFLTLPRENSGQLRLRLLPIPRDGGTLTVIGKRVCPELVEDGDRPLLSGSDNALIAYAMGDMFEFMRQFSKAQAKFTEGAAHAANMANLEDAQAAQVVRLIPNPEPLSPMDGGYFWP